MSEEIAWPVDGWRTVTRASPEAGVIVSVGRLGVTLSIGARVIPWPASATLELRAIETDATVFLSLAEEAGGTIRLQAPPGCKPGVLPKRVMVRLGACGGIALGLRTRQEVKHRVDGGVLQLAVPRASDGAEVAPRAPKAAKADAKDARAFDVVSLVAFAQDAAWKALPVKVDRADRKVRIAAAVALVTFGTDKDAVRDALGVSNVLLPDLEDMPRPSRDAAQAALTALREATDE